MKQETSELALQIAQRHVETTKTVGAIRLAKNVDAELQEVRETLEGLQTFWLDQGDDSPVEWHWCDPDADCGDECSRARALWAKLQIGGHQERG